MAATLPVLVTKEFLIGAIPASARLTQGVTADGGLVVRISVTCGDETIERCHTIGDDPAVVTPEIVQADVTALLKGLTDTLAARQAAKAAIAALKL